MSRPGSRGGEVQYFLLSDQKSIEGNDIIAQGRMREVVIDDHGSRSHRDSIFTLTCATEPHKGDQRMMIMYGNEPYFIDPTLTQLSVVPTIPMRTG